MTVNLNLRNAGLTGLILVGVPDRVTIDVQLPNDAVVIDARLALFQDWRQADKRVRELRERTSRDPERAFVLYWRMKWPDQWAYTATVLRAADVAICVRPDGVVDVVKNRDDSEAALLRRILAA